MSAPPAIKLSARDLEIAGLVWRCFKSEPQVDYNKLAELAGFKNSGTASACWGPIKKRLMGTTTSTPSKPRAPRSSSATGTPKQRASKVTAPAHDDDEEENNAGETGAGDDADAGVKTGSKRKRTTAKTKTETGAAAAKKSKKAVKTEDGEVKDDGEGFTRIDTEDEA